MNNIIYPDHVSLHSDTRNLYHDTRVSVPNGMQIRTAYLKLKKREHQTSHNVSITQPAMISISKDVFIDFKDAVNKVNAKGVAEGVEYSGLATLKSAANEIKQHSYVDASTHGVVHVKAMADGKRWSSRDGVIVADLIIVPEDTRSSKDVTELITNIIIALDKTTQEGVNEAVKVMGQLVGRDLMP